MSTVPGAAMKSVPVISLVLLLVFAAGAAVAKPLIAISEISLSDTSGTPATAAGSVWSDVKRLTSAIDSGLKASGLYDTKLVKRADCEDKGPGCLAAWAKATGGKVILMGTVLKTTPTTNHFWVGVFKADATTRLLFRDIVISGSGPDAWKRAGDSLVADIVKARPGL